MSGRLAGPNRPRQSAALGRGRRALVAVVACIVGVATGIALPGGAPVGAAPTDGPGGPVLVVTSATNPFSGYLAEVLRNEGLNAFDVADVASLTPELLDAHEVVVLGEVAVGPAEVAALSSWVSAGGDLIAMRPDPDLAGLVGLTDTGTDLSDAYLAIDTTAGTPGAGLVAETIQFHGTADRYELQPGTEAVASLASTADAVTAHPAVTLRSRGERGGPGGRLHLRPRPLRGPDPSGQPGLGGPGARRPAAADHPLRRPLLPRLGRSRQGPDPPGRRAAAAPGQHYRARQQRRAAAPPLLVLAAGRAAPPW